MAEKNYSKRELDHWFGDFFGRMDDQDEILKRIETQTTTTNGRVTKLEWWQKAVIWGLGALWTLILLGLGIGIPILRDSSKERDAELQKKIDLSVSNAFEKIGVDYDKIIINNK